MTVSSPAARADESGRLELTLRGLVLGGLITLVFTAANVYLGLRVGLTFASSIPAAVISMAVLRMMKLHQHLREQHRPDGGLGGGHPVVDHLRAAGPGDGRLVGRPHPVLADLRGSARSAACSG